MAIGFSYAISRRRQMENGRQLSDQIAGEIAASYPLPALVQDILALFKAGMGWVLPPPIARCPGADDRHRGVVKYLRKIAIVLTGSSPHEWRLCARTGPSSNVAFDPGTDIGTAGSTQLEMSAA
jgi:hypothetical protein